MSVQVVFVHGIRTSATMWRAQVEHLSARGIVANAVDLPGHGARMDEDFTLASALDAVDTAVRDAAARGPVVLAAHSMGALLSTAYVGGVIAPPVDAFISAGGTAFPRGLPLRTYRTLLGVFDALPDHGGWLADRVLAATHPPETRDDFGAGGYAFATQDPALAALAMLDLRTALTRIRIPMWFVNGQFDQLRINERQFTALAAHAELVVVPQTTHLITTMRPRVFNAVLDLAVAVTEANARARRPS